MARREQHDLRLGGGLGPDAVHVRGEGRLRGPQVEAGEGVERLAQGRPVRGHERGQLVEDAVHLRGLGDLRLPPGVAQLDHDERLDEQGLAAARRVVDDALDPRAGLGLDRHDVPAVAERDDRLLERAAQLRADERVQAPPQPVVGDPHGRAQPAQARRGGVEQLPDRIEAAGQRAAQGGQRMQFAGRARAGAFDGRRRGRREAGRRVEGLRELEELGRFEAAATDRALDRRPDVARGTDADAGPLGQERAGLIGLVEAARDDDRVVRRLQRLGQPAGRRERGRLGEPRPDERELEQRDRSFVHRDGRGRRQRDASGPETDGCPATTNRHGRLVHGSPA